MSGEDAKAAGLYEVIGEEIDDKYMEALKKLVLRPEAIKEQADKLKIVYTPLHGLSLIHISEPTRPMRLSRMPSSA